VNLDIRTFIQTATALAAFFAALFLLNGIRALRRAATLRFFRLKHEQLVRGWRMIFLALASIGVAFLLPRFGEPAIYRFYPPTATPLASPTATLSPTPSPIPSATLTPTITPTPQYTYTPTITPTPHVPLAIEAQFTSSVTPDPFAVFSPLQFTQRLDALGEPIQPAEVFQNPVGHLYAVFTYDGMIPGVQWTALWYRGDELAHYETKPWDGGTGGYGFTEWNPPAEEWLPGTYRVIIFVGTEAKTAGEFIVEGNPPTHTPTPSATLTPTPSNTPTPTRTRAPTLTPPPSPTRWPTATPITPSPTATRAPTATATPSSTP